MEAGPDLLGDYCAQDVRPPEVISRKLAIAALALHYVLMVLLMASSAVYMVREIARDCDCVENLVPRYVVRARGARAVPAPACAD